MQAPDGKTSQEVSSDQEKNARTESECGMPFPNPGTLATCRFVQPGNPQGVPRPIRRRLRAMQRNRMTWGAIVACLLSWGWPVNADVPWANGDTWAATLNMAQVRTGASTALLPDAKALITGR